ncbi:MAG: phage tail tape measure protein [Acutalibacter muris]|nr:phage tail tape measure protein [Acutalibacter muris]
MTFDSTMSQVGAISGATGVEFDSLRDKAIEMGSKTKFSASESAEAFTYMAMAGWKTGDMLNGIEGIMNLAAASGEDLALTSDIVTDALTAFGMSAEESGHFADILAVASSNANTNVSMMGDTFRYVAPVAGALGYSAEDTALAIGLMASSGIKASQAGTSLRSIITRLSTDAGASSKSLGALGVLTEKLGVEFYNADGSARNLNDVLTDARVVWSGLSEEQQISYAKTIAGQEAMSGWLAIMNAAPADIEKLTSSIRDADGAAEAMADTMMDNLAGDITYFKSALEGAQIVLSDQLTPTIREFVQFGTNAISTLSTAFQDGGLSGAMEALGVILSDGLNMVISKLPEMVDAGMQLLGALGMGLLNNLPAITTAAVQIILTLVQGFISALPYIAQGAVQIISQLAMGIGQALPTLIPAAVQAILTFLMGLTSPESLNSLINGALVLIQGLVIGIARALPLIVQSAGDIIANLISGLADNAPHILEVGFQLLGELIKGLIMGLVQLPGALVKIGSALIDGIKNAVGGVWDWITGKNKDSLDTIETDIDDTWGRTQDSTQQAWGGMQTQVGSSMSSMVGLTNTGTQDISSSISAGWGNSLLSTQQSWPGMESQVDSSMANMVGLTNTGTGNIVSAFDEGWYNANISTEQGMGGILSTTDLLSGKAVTAVDTNFGKMEGTVVGNLNEAKAAAGRVDFSPIGVGAVDGMSEGAKSRAAKLANTMVGAAMDAFNAAKAALQVNSPSKRGEWLWQMVMDGSVLGVDKNAYKLADAMESASEGALEAFNVKSKDLDFGVFTPAPIDFSAYVKHYEPYDSNRQGREVSGQGNTTVNIYSPKAVDAVQAAREWKKTTQQLAMGF